MDKSARTTHLAVLLLTPFWLAFAGCPGGGSPDPTLAPSGGNDGSPAQGGAGPGGPGGSGGSGGSATRSAPLDGGPAVDASAPAAPDARPPAADRYVGADVATATDSAAIPPAGGTPAPTPSATGGAAGNHLIADAGASDAGAAPASPGQACAAEPLRSTGQIYYVCDCQAGAAASCVAGDDSNPGTSPSAPLQSFARAAAVFAGANAGDTVALCRGGRWSVSSGQNFANPNCSHTNTCDLRDYIPPSAQGSEGMPSIWINGGSNGATLMSFSHLPSHQEGIRVFNFDLHGTSKDMGIFFWNETTNVDLCDLAMDGFNESVTMSGGDAPTYGTPASIVLRGSRLTNNSNIAYIGVCDQCSVEDNFFDNNGVVNATTHAVYFASQAWNVSGQWVVHETVGMQLLRNEIHNSAIVCNGSPVVVHGRHTGVVIENNLVDAVNASADCWGPGVGCGGYPYGCWFRNTIIRGNTITNLGNTGSNSNNCTGCLIENNFITMSTGGNAISLGTLDPRAVGDPTYTKWDGQPDDPSANITVRNNTVYFTPSAPSGVAVLVGSGTGDRIENNAFAYAAGQAGPSDNLFLSLPALSAVTLVDYNLGEIPAGAHWAVSTAGGLGMSLPAWQTASAFDLHSKMANPMFVFPPGNCAPAPGSPLIQAGDPADCPATDLNGSSSGSPPAIGAFEP